MTTRPNSPAGTADGPRPGSLESRASLALKLLAAVNGFAILLAMVPGTIPSSRLQVTTLHGAALALSGLYVLVAWMLDRRQPWAVSAIRPLLVLLLGWGVYSGIATLAAGAFRIPFPALAAGWALLGTADRTPLPRLTRPGAGVLAATAALIGAMLVNQPIFGWGGYFDVHPPDLHAVLAADCGTSGSAPPERIAITYTWSWSSTTVLPNEEDVVFIGWNSDDGTGHSAYFFDRAPDAGTGIQLGSSTGVSAAMVDEAAAGWRGRLEWKIDLSARGIQSGRISVVLVRAENRQSPPSPVTIGASYVHVGVWRSDAPQVTCSW